MKRRRRLRFQHRVLLWVLATAAPGWAVATGFLWYWQADDGLRITVFALMNVFFLAGLLAVRARVVRPLQSLANMLEALREGDYSLRARHADPDDAFGEVMVEVNSLSRTLYDQRLEALEAGVLLQKIIAEIDIAVFAFGPDLRLRLVNRAGAALLGGTLDELKGRTAVELGLAGMLEQRSGMIVQHVFPSGTGRWEVRLRSFREAGRRHELLVISDLSRALRDEERQAWRRLVRVIGHELNSSLAPIKSMAGTLRKLVEREPLASDWREDARAGLTVIHDRSDSLGRFMGAYARLAKLPLPKRRRASFAAAVGRVVSLYSNRVVAETSTDVMLDMDADQIEQVLINLIKNAVEATAERGGVRIRWGTEGAYLVAEIEDDGPGLARTENLWVPFFTTKPGGSGIGLVLSREIIENHGGSISLENRVDASGCIGRVRLPL